MRLVIIDNYDSFTFNLVQLFSAIGVEVEVYRNDEISVEQLTALKFDAICLSPGPKTPADSGICKAVVEHFCERVPILGICLGMQIINEVFAGKTIKASLPMHGKTTLLNHDGSGLFAGLPPQVSVARYHSLIVEVASDQLRINASADAVPMSFTHRELPIFGLQFHPESFMTEDGKQMARNFVRIVESGKC
jgi:anthranilate synthase component 2